MKYLIVTILLFVVSVYGQDGKVAPPAKKAPEDDDNEEVPQEVPHSPDETPQEVPQEVP